MQCVRIKKSIFKKIKKPKPKSRKYQNGLTLIIAGSKQYHGSLVFSAITASRLVDIVFVCTSKENIPLIKRIGPAMIVSPLSKAMERAKESDSILVGPGLEQNMANKRMVAKILKKFSKTPTVIDAGGLRLIKPNQVHSNCCLTPHSNEFKALFKEKMSAQSVLKNAKKFGCIIAGKGPIDFISNGKKLYCNYTGNQGMTKGGTGDTLAGLVAGFAAKNHLLESALAAAYLNGCAGDELYKKNGQMYNAKDLMNMLPSCFKNLV
ncbi:MAG: NAD(P)H-hydrate dehydratase [Candidatus Diapherotrites archaeon]|nr:NAD(P)H-hydrate dehydratase [Candidatus Diapherotrites archaeon]